MSSSLGLRRIVALFLLGAALAACCPTRQLRFDTPEAALASWQSQLCHDDTRAEYRCLHHDLKLAMGGFPTYVSARHRLLEDHPFAAAFLKYGDLAGRDHERRELDADRVSFEYLHDGQRFALGFQRELWAVARFGDGRPELERRLDLGSAALVRASGPRQWIDLPTDFLTDEQRAALHAVRLEHRWKIAAVDGLLAADTAARGAAPPTQEPQP